jgi:hypothetical protein
MEPVVLYYPGTLSLVTWIGILSPFGPQKVKSERLFGEKARFCARCFACASAES